MYLINKYNFKSNLWCCNANTNFVFRSYLLLQKLIIHKNNLIETICIGSDWKWYILLLHSLESYNLLLFSLIVIVSQFRWNVAWLVWFPALGKCVPQLRRINWWQIVNSAVDHISVKKHWILQCRDRCQMPSLLLGRV